MQNVDVNTERIEKQFASFCCKVIKTALIDYQRREERSKKHNVPAIPISALAGNENFYRASFDEIVEAHKIYIQPAQCTVDIKNTYLAEALNRLPDNYRNILVMTYMLDIPDREIGQAIGISHQRVSAVRKKALQDIGEIIVTGVCHEE